jgi:hypothetical protein
MMNKLHCEGGCWFYPHQNNTDCECEGELSRVEVSNLKTGTNWGEFIYCEKAIKEDLKNGFTVKILDRE